LLLSQWDLPVAAFSMSNGTNLAGLLQNTQLIANLKMIFSFSMPHPIFTNAGTLAAVLLLGWRRRFLPYMIVLMASFAGLMMYGGFAETRNFMQILPLSLILLSERWQEYAGAGATGESSGETAMAWAVRKTFPVLVPLTIGLIVVSTGIAGWRYYNIFENMQPENLMQSELGMHVIKPEGGAADLAAENQLLRRGYAGAELKLAAISSDNRQFSDAIHHYQRALELDTNSVPALNNLAWLLATAPDPGLRNGKEAVRLAERACRQSEFKEALLLGTLAAAYAEAGRFDDAVATAQKARELALTNGQKDVADANERLLELYKSRQPYHQEARPVPGTPEIPR
jgi:tetratricopeptide (TPR) repeat protein